MAGNRRIGPDGPNPPEILSDHSLLRRFRDGSQEAASQLYLRYAHRLHGLAQAKVGADLAQRLDFEDIVQSVFGSFFRRVGQSYYDVPAEEELWRLFVVIAVHKIQNQGEFHRAQKRAIGRTQTGPDGERAIAQQVGQDDAAYVFFELVVKESLEELPAAQRQMIELRMEGYEVAEIAVRTGRAKRTVERLLQDARQQLGKLLGEDAGS